MISTQANLTGQARPLHLSNAALVADWQSRLSQYSPADREAFHLQLISKLICEVHNSRIVLDEMDAAEKAAARPSSFRSTSS